VARQLAQSGKQDIKRLLARHEFHMPRASVELVTSLLALYTRKQPKIANSLSLNQ
jgi:hypothetical protein